ncbi:MAG: hypothetical protein ACYTG6_03860 [Planctomycetota bacterium]|jgi:hypothetical protein
MLKRLSLVFGLVLVVGALSGCRLGAPAAESLGGYPYGAHGSFSDTKSKAILRQWGRDAREGERFIDQYFLNYNINDPYRGDALVGW